MNYYKAREIQRNGEATGKWRFTKRNDDAIWAVGYCREKECEHETPEAACDCYRQYCLDNEVKEYTTSGHYPCEYEGCDKLTNKVIECNGHSAYLCEDHRDKSFLKDMMNWGNTMSITSST